MTHSKRPDTPTVGDFIVTRLAAWGIRRLFGK